ncbi:fungal specific transcription factor domain-containing protein [Penicillium taxi]|uniref:fungal specific transcription factor domain-containing protein n=1 Tax=Penicillium taxi TaxID=168475 RepID=UPI0025457195|nr:fungal specific transcription factor domain-containing protein [Penicillium taxi]KAJ5895440.1 fungal specific transcription factor domain-containing protein [Penicillium taxi]
MSSPVGIELPLAKFACDHCRRRKLKCSRKLTKCDNCMQWTSGCSYSHAPKKRMTTSSKQDAAAERVEDRLDRIENTLAQLTAAVGTLTQLFQTHLGSETSQPEPVQRASAEPSQRDYAVALDPSHVFSSFPDTPADLQSIQSQIKIPNQLDGSASLQDLTDALASVRLPTDREEGQKLKDVFMMVVEKGHPLHLPPPRELLSKIIYEPSAVTERGWIVLFNFLSLVATTGQDPLSKAMSARLRWNTWLALDDSSLFLEPLQINILALLTIASHGEDFTTPNMSWLLVGHACRLAQAANIRPPTLPDNDLKKQQLFLFWSLFVTDKSVALAFGRPPALSSTYYQSLSLPDAIYFTDFAPHILLRTRSNVSIESRFGANFFVRAIALAHVRANISDFLGGRGVLSPIATVQKSFTLEKDLSDWYHDTKTLLVSSRQDDIPNTNEAEQMEMHIAIESMTFQYHHLRVLLTRQDEKSVGICLQSAREAILTLDNLVSSSSRVYNGIIWQLLYFPFTPFFAIFRHIIRAPMAATAASDLQLLQSTVSYYSRMTSQGIMASKLEKIAHVFACLAGLYMQDAFQNAIIDTKAPGPSNSSMTEVAGFNVAFQPASPLPFGEESFLTDISMDDILDWFSQDNNFEDLSRGEDFGPVASSNILGSISSRTRKRPLDCDFDWISWDLSHNC